MVSGVCSYYKHSPLENCLTLSMKNFTSESETELPQWNAKYKLTSLVFCGWPTVNLANSSAIFAFSDSKS